MRIGHISTFPPTKCGIAIFAQDLIDNLADVSSLRFRLCYGHDESNDFEYQARSSAREEFETLGRAVNVSGADVVDLQHEFGIWGGTEGEYIVPFLERCNKPIVATLHTPRCRTRGQAELLKLLCQKSASVVVLTGRGREAIDSLVPECRKRVMVIRHGTPDVAYIPPNGQEGYRANPITFISPGFYRPDKGLEIVLDAFSALKESGMEFLYRIIGGPQPQFAGQREYYDKIVSLIRMRDLQEHVEVICDFFDRNDMIRHIQESDCGVIGYTDMNHSSSGIIPLILGCGRPVISTPIEYAEDMASLIRGIYLTSSATVESIAKTLAHVIAHRVDIEKLMPIIYSDTRKWIWKRSAEEYLAVFRGACI